MGDCKFNGPLHDMAQWLSDYIFKVTCFVRPYRKDIGLFGFINHEIGTSPSMVYAWSFGIIYIWINIFIIRRGWKYEM